MRSSKPRRLAVAVLSVALAGCASVERGRYGIGTLEIEGVEAFDARALEACLASRERDDATIELGFTRFECNEPPFDGGPVGVDLWAWPWTDWSHHDPAVFERDLERIRRWYRARGYYDAKVVAVRFDPPHAEHPERGAPEGACNPDEEECVVEILVRVEEGEPLRLRDITVKGVDALSPEAARAVAEVELPARGDRLDEAVHDATKSALREALRRASHAGAEVEGEIHLDRAARRADLVYVLVPGPAYRFGVVRVHGAEELPVGVIREAAGVPEGEPYAPDVLDEAQAEVYALDAFSSVAIEERLRPEDGRVDVDVDVERLPPDNLRVGIGVMSGALRRTETGELTSVPQWDVHLFGRYERRHLFGTLARVRIEERPRLIMNDSFPTTTVPRFGNLVDVSARAPGTLDARTVMTPRVRWDLGPEPFLGFYRSDLMLRVGLERSLGTRALVGVLAVQQDVFDVLDDARAWGDPPTDHRHRFLEQAVRLDLRSDDVWPRKGFYGSVLLQEAVRSPAAYWTLFRVSPELRGYVPLPLATVLAARFGIGALFVGSADPRLGAAARELGPYPYRLRGGGANGNRGFLPGRLGDGREGGLRRWEGSVELRLRLGEAVGLTFFADAGDVHRGPTFRFDHLNTSVGFGLRYLTLVGPIRFDVGFRIPRWARIDGGDASFPEDPGALPFGDTPGALHLTIGEAF